MIFFLQMFCVYPKSRIPSPIWTLDKRCINACKITHVDIYCVLFSRWMMTAFLYREAIFCFIIAGFWSGHGNCCVTCLHMYLENFFSGGQFGKIPDHMRKDMTTGTFGCILEIHL